MLSSGSETQEEQGAARGTAARFDEGKFQDDHKPSGEPVILMKEAELHSIQEKEHITYTFFVDPIQKLGAISSNF